MSSRCWLSVVASLLLIGGRPVSSQDIDANITSRNRGPAAIADQIRDPVERGAFTALFRKVDPREILREAEAFLAKYPDSAFLAQTYEIAARANFDIGNDMKGLEYAHDSLVLLPENPLLLVAVADVQAREHQNDDAILNATDALRYLDELAHPISILEENWPDVKRQEEAIAHFAIGRAKLQEALKENPGEKRQALLKAALTSLAQASALNLRDMEVRYLLGIAYLPAGNPSQAARELAAVSDSGGVYAPRAQETLRELYKSLVPDGKVSFQDYVARAGGSKSSVIPPVAAHVMAVPAKLPDYAGSHVCQECHIEIYRNWSESGMAKMLRPYQAENVIGDFTKNNEFYTGGDIQYLHGKLNVLPGKEQKLFARMVMRSGKHYFEIQQSDGSWHSYPVDYTIGSKWQQAYATKLSNGQIHVFPIQYSVLEKKWLNYWRSLDGTGSERSDPYNFERLDDSTSYQVKCAVCHTSQLRNTKGQGLQADGLEFREPGIGCEMCHGPSAGHVAGMMRGEGDEHKAALDPPVDFRKISSRDFDGELNYSPTGKFFQENLSVPLGEFTRKGFYKDGRFSQTTFIVEALERSKCFRLGQATCGSCHDPHSHDFSTNRTSLRFQEEPDKMCTGCHTQFQDELKAAAHTHHSNKSEGSRCVSCHMPRIMDALTFSARTHQIDDIPNAEMTLRFGQQESPNACLICHKEKDAQWVRGQLESWAVKPPATSAVSMRDP
jgi:predicted CXXCH cytochrome family protein